MPRAREKLLGARRRGLYRIKPGKGSVVRSYRCTKETPHPHQYSTRLGTVGLMDLTPTSMNARIIRLGETPGLRNPGEELSLTVTRESLPC